MKAVIFDMDGTIIDSSVAIERTINDIRAELKLEPLSSDFIIKAINEPGRNLALDLYNMQNPTAKLRDNFEENFKINYAKYAKAYNGIEELLKKCLDSGFSVALASNAPQNTLEDILKKCEIFKYFDFIVGASSEIPQKPDPKMLLICTQKLSASKAIFVGDSLKDELAAKNANMPYIQVTWGFGKHSKTSDYNASSTNEAWSIIEEI
ncbi:HAD-IA family hydrolase [Campylobacter mucosalis]|uniref:HAD-IA family hydrolase n=1 Tax=Campylobacter mucosalis TaxID=202 RepID=UPI00147053FD